MDRRLRLLLDTHALIWALHTPKRLAVKARQAIEAEENNVFVSVVSPWELAIKGPREGLHIPDDLQAQLDRQNFKLLPVLLRHTEPLGELPYHHRDPFDRMLVAQALSENMIIVTADRKMRDYPVGLMRAA